MYNSKVIDYFLEKVNKEAEQAAQKVFDSYESQFKTKVLNQMRSGDKLNLSMGSGYMNKDTVNDEFITSVANIQYMEQRASFDTYIFIK